MMYYEQTAYESVKEGICFLAQAELNEYMEPFAFLAQILGKIWRYWIVPSRTVNARLSSLQSATYLPYSTGRTSEAEEYRSREWALTPNESLYIYLHRVTSRTNAIIIIFTSPTSVYERDTPEELMSV